MLYKMKYNNAVYTLHVRIRIDWSEQIVQIQIRRRDKEFQAHRQVVKGACSNYRIDIVMG